MHVWSMRPLARRRRKAVFSCRHSLLTPVPAAQYHAGVELSQITHAVCLLTGVRLINMLLLATWCQTCQLPPFAGADGC